MLAGRLTRGVTAAHSDSGPSSTGGYRTPSNYVDPTPSYADTTSTYTGTSATYSTEQRESIARAVRVWDHRVDARYVRPH